MCVYVHECESRRECGNVLLVSVCRSEAGREGGYVCVMCRWYVGAIWESDGWISISM